MIFQIVSLVIEHLLFKSRRNSSHPIFSSKWILSQMERNIKSNIVTSCFFQYLNKSFPPTDKSEVAHRFKDLGEEYFRGL